MLDMSRTGWKGHRAGECSDESQTCRPHERYSTSSKRWRTLLENIRRKRKHATLLQIAYRKTTLGIGQLYPFPQFWQWKVRIFSNESLSIFQIRKIESIMKKLYPVVFLKIFRVKFIFVLLSILILRTFCLPTIRKYTMHFVPLSSSIRNQHLLRVKMAGSFISGIDSVQ